MGVKIKIRLAEVLREDGSKEYCCFADEPPLTALEEQIYAEALRETGPLENILGIRGREDLYLSFREGLKGVVSRLNVDLTEEQEGRLLLPSSDSGHNFLLLSGITQSDISKTFKSS
jgi:hypothetical protein